MNHDALYPQRVAGYEIETLDGGAVLFHTTSLSIVHLNRSAALLYSLCDGRQSADEIVAMLVDAYPDVAARIPGEVDRALNMLVRAGALILVPASSDEPSTA